VNNQRVERRTPVDDQDCIRIHDIILRFEVQADGDQKVPSPATISDTAAMESVAGPAGRVVSTLEPPADVTAADRDSSLVKLRAVIELTKNLGSSLELDEVLPGILDCLFQIFPQTERGYILQRKSDKEGLQPIAIKHRQGQSDTISPLGGTIVARVMQEGTAFLSSDPHQDDRLQEASESIFEEDLRSVMCAPLIGPSQKPLGVIHVETNDPDHPFVQHDLDMLISVGNLAGRAAEAAQMHETILALDRQKHEVGMARDVQLQFLPSQRPDVPGYKFYDYYRAADQMAGDYYDYIELPDGRWGLALGDVSGKGMSAALLMARLCSDVRYCLLATDTPAEAVARLNRQLRKQLVGDRFVTLILCVLDPQKHIASIVNAGHMPPLARLDGGAVQELGSDDVCLPLGVEKDTEYGQLDVAIPENSVIFAYTDGVSEAMDPAGHLYGSPRVWEVMGRTNPDPVHVGQALVADVKSFVQGHLQSDDICLLGFGREPA
ncbi:MAG: SpoIIE family protein phosphatase, partial [Planctomycetota bacterium]|nr:SpoIIE family protein phosphatase [Planctomycetota bacterium]